MKSNDKTKRPRNVWFLDVNCPQIRHLEKHSNPSLYYMHNASLLVHIDIGENQRYWPRLVSNWNVQNESEHTINCVFHILSEQCRLCCW